MTHRKILFEDVEGERRVYPHKYQKEALKDLISRYIFMIAGSGGGKSSFAPIWIYQRMSTRPGCMVMFVEPTFKMLNNIAIPKVIEFFKGTPAEGEFIAKTMTYHSKMGDILFISADKPDLMEGLHVDFIVADEIGQYKRRAWVVLSNRITMKDGQLLGITTPYNLGWLYREPYQEWKKDRSPHHGGYHFIQFASAENPAINKGDIEQKRKEMSPEEFAMRYEGKFAQARGLVYDLPEGSVIPVPEPGENDEVFVSIDFGFGDPTVFLYYYIKNNTFYFFKEYVANATLYEEHVNSNIQDFIKYNIRNIFYDPSGAQAAAQMRKCFEDAGLITKWHPARNNLQDGIRKVKKILLPGNMCFSELMSVTLDEFENYVFDDKGEPKDESNHTMDCVRYAVQGYITLLYVRGRIPIPTIKLRSLAAQHIDELFTTERKTTWMEDF
jgi:hypothetical protein